VLAGCGGAAKTPPVVWKRGDVHFGVLAPLSGPEAARGRDLLDGARLAAADLNVRGGVLGKRVRVDALDDGCDSARSAASARQLAGRTLGGALGTICPGAAAAAARTLGDGLPFLVTSANAKRIVRGSATAYLT
jgi:branched-chain amino acid transport system substrate-binding protein